MRINIKYFKYVIFAIILIMIVPIFIDFFIIGNKFSSNISNSDWVLFLGSYIGSIIGSAATLIGIMITLNFTRNQADYDRESSREEISEERRLSLVPYFKFDMNELGLPASKHDMCVFYSPDENCNTYVNAIIAIKNVGMGPLIDFKVYDISFNDNSINQIIDGENDVLEKNSEWLMLIDLRLRLDEIKNEILIKHPSGEYSVPPECSKGGTLFFSIGYKDLVGNEYKQDIKILVLIAYLSKVGVIGFKYSKPELRVESIGKSKLVKTPR